jgi:hypothetical protein
MIVTKAGVGKDAWNVSVDSIEEAHKVLQAPSGASFINEQWY